MENLPVEIIEQIILRTDNKSFEKICKTNSRLESVCHNVARKKLKQMGYKVPKTSLNYTYILQQFSNSNIGNKKYRLAAVFLDGCNKNKLDCVKFFLLQDLTKVESVLGSKSSELIRKCLATAISKNYKDIVRFLEQNKN